jgi:hypothetical protein
METLPVEILAMVLSYNRHKDDFLSARLTCKRWNDLFVTGGLIHLIPEPRMDTIARTLVYGTQRAVDYIVTAKDFKIDELTKRHSYVDFVPKTFYVFFDDLIVTLIRSQRFYSLAVIIQKLTHDKESHLFFAHEIFASMIRYDGFGSSGCASLVDLLLSRFFGAAELVPERNSGFKGAEDGTETLIVSEENMRSLIRKGNLATVMEIAKRFNAANYTDLVTLIPLTHEWTRIETIADGISNGMTENARIAFSQLIQDSRCIPHLRRITAAITDIGSIPCDNITYATELLKSRINRHICKDDLMDLAIMGIRATYMMLRHYADLDLQSDDLISLEELLDEVLARTNDALGIMGYTLDEAAFKNEVLTERVLQCVKKHGIDDDTLVGMFQGIIQKNLHWQMDPAMKVFADKLADKVICERIFTDGLQDALLNESYMCLHRLSTTTHEIHFPPNLFRRLVKLGYELAATKLLKMCNFDVKTAMFDHIDELLLASNQPFCNSGDMRKLLIAAMDKHFPEWIPSKRQQQNGDGSHTLVDWDSEIIHLATEIYADYMTKLFENVTAKSCVFNTRLIKKLTRMLTENLDNKNLDERDWQIIYEEITKKYDSMRKCKDACVSGQAFDELLDILHRKATHGKPNRKHRACKRQKTIK